MPWILPDAKRTASSTRTPAIRRCTPSAASGTASRSLDALVRGFFPGILWLLHEHTGEPAWRQLAEEYSSPLEPRRFDRDVHDLGFLFFSTYLRWFHLTGDPALQTILIDAGRTLALRRQKGGYLASFIGPDSLFIDIMMNVGLILWAANATER